MEAALDIDKAKVGTVRDLILDCYIYASGRTNGWFLRRIAASESSAPRHLPRCVRVQREKEMADLGSLPSLDRPQHIAIAEDLLQQGWPKADIDQPSAMLRAQPELPTFAAAAKSDGG